MHLKESDNDPAEENKAEDAARKFMQPMRPNNQIWNFVQDAKPTPHVLRASADPNQSYIDGRVGKLLEIIEALGIHIKNYSSENWKRLGDYTWLIFSEEEEEVKMAFEAWQKEDQQ